MAKRTMPIHPDYGNIVCSAVRYALGRHTYIVPLTADYVLQHWQYIDECSKHNVLSDIDRFLTTTPIKDEWGDFDRARWQCLYDKLRAMDTV